MEFANMPKADDPKNRTTPIILSSRKPTNSGNPENVIRINKPNPIESVVYHSNVQPSQ
jgi:hypothetical protein